MEWLIRALSAVREVRDLSSPKTSKASRGAKGKNGVRPSTPPPAQNGTGELVARPLGPAKAKSQPAPAAAAPQTAPTAPAAPVRAPAPASSPPPQAPAPADREAAIARERDIRERARQAKEARRAREAARDAAREKKSSGGDEPKQELPLRLIDRDALEVVRRLRRFGHTAYLVGGCVRDLWLGLTPKDFDVATSARPEQIRAVFRNCRIIGRRFRLAHVYFRGGKVIETSTFRAMVQTTENEEEGEEPQDLLIRHDNVFGSEEEDAKRRDFTINALFYDVASGKIIDHVGGLADLKARKVRMIGDPDIRLREDPIRILRAARIAAKIDFDIDNDLKEAMRRHKAEIERCSKSRVLEETLKLLRGGNAARAVRWLDEAEVLDALMPEVFEHLARTRTAGGAESFYVHLGALDARVRRGPVDDAVVLAALLQPLIDEVQGSGAPVERFHLAMDLIDRVGARMAVTRRLSERLRQIVTAQRHFERAPSGKRTRRRVSPTTLARRTFFQDAVDLFEVRSVARGEPLEAIDEWRGKPNGRPQASEDGDESGEAPSEATTEGAEPAAGAQEEDEPRRRRRRRRRPAPSTPQPE